jgi:endonuclease III
MKKAFRLKTVLAKLEKAIASFPKAAMFELYERGFRSVFQQLVSCIISIRTRDETTIPVSLALLEKAPDPESFCSSRKMNWFNYPAKHFSRAQGQNHAGRRPPGHGTI